MKKNQLPPGLKIIRFAAKSVLSILALPLWHLERLIPRNRNLWIFGSMDGTRYTDNARFFFEYVNANHPEINAVWTTRSRTIYAMLHERGYKAVMMYSLKGWRYALAAFFFFSDHGSCDYNRHAANGAKIVNLWHGMPMKTVRILYDEYFRHKKSSILAAKINYFIRPWDRNTFAFMPVTSEFFIPFLQASFSDPFGRPASTESFSVTGYPRNDFLLQTDEIPFVSEIRAEFPGARIMFYLPTFRLSLYTGEPFNPFAPEFGFDAEEFEAFLEEKNIVFLYKPHPYETLSGIRDSRRFRIIKNDGIDNLYTFLSAVDILVTDYSSVYFDFKITGKPAVLLPLDFENYEKIRGLFFDYREVLPDKKARDWHEFYRIFDGNLTVQKEKDRLFNKWCDANSCRRIFDAVCQLSSATSAKDRNTGKAEKQ